MDTTSARKARVLRDIDANLLTVYKQVVAKVDLSHRTSPSPRPVSPYKSSSPNVGNNGMLRPKAKVNSSAKINTTNGARRVSGTMSAVSSPVVRTPASSSIPRPASPVKYSAPPVGRSQSAHTSSASYGGSSRPRAALTQNDVASRQRALTNTSTSSLSATSHSSASSLQRGVRARTSSGTFTAPLTPVANNIHLSPDPAIRVKSKVSNLAKAPGPISAPTSPLHVSRTNSNTTSGKSSPPYATTGRPVRKVRSPPMPDFGGPSSVPSSPVLPTSPPPSIHAAVSPPSSAPADQRRSSGQLRHPPPLERRPFPSSPTPAPAPASQSQARTAKVDVSALPPLPNSPPGSTVSFSSHSSRSSLSQVAYSSASEASSTAPTVYSHVNAEAKATKPEGEERYGGLPDQRGVFDAIVGLFDPSSRRTSAATTVDPNREGSVSPSPSSLMPTAPGSQIRAAAKSNRKIEDLEITNRSLLAINASLEGQKHKQAKEIRELRRKLRESRLILPPRAYRALKSSDGPAPADEPTASSSEDDEEMEPDVHDETYERVKGLLDRLLNDAKAALTSTPDDHRAAKVLTAEELRDWRDDSFTQPGDVSLDLGDVSIDDSEADPTEGANTAGPNSEDEVEASLLLSQLRSSRGPLPSVTVTMS
ncbi:unnamed protein product [Peniophora sp. CBMAI 1063]|nr:unnamed protein product [Peniophora sp. CBMAI 1063]